MKGGLPADIYCIKRILIDDFLAASQANFFPSYDVAIAFLGTV
jgi:hypothetical protein